MSMYRVPGRYQVPLVGKEGHHQTSPFTPDTAVLRVLLYTAVWQNKVRRRVFDCKIPGYHA